MSETVQIPKGWELKKISDCGQIITGSTPKTTNSEFYGNDFPFFGPSDLGSKIEISESQKGLTQAGLDEARVIPENSILVQCIGDLGKSSIIKKTGACNQQINVIIPNPDTVIPKFVYYWINSNFFREQMSQHATQTTLPILNKTKFSNLPFLIPSIPTQKKIVQKLDDILGQLKEKKKEIFPTIETNKQRIDFFEKNWISYVIDNEIEKHPNRKEWKLVKLSEISYKITDGTHKSPKNHVSGDFYYITAKNVRPGKINFKTATFVSKEDHAEIFARCNPEKNDVLFTKDGAGLGYSVVNEVDFPFSMLSSVALIKPDFSKINPYYISFFLNSGKALDQIKSIITGSAIKRIVLRDIKNLEIPFPPLPIQKQIVQNIKNAEEKFQSQKVQFENIKQNYEKTINYINHIQSSILDTAFSGKLVK